MTAATGVKVCGLKNTEIINQLHGLAISEVGFVLAPSRRQVTPEQAGSCCGPYVYCAVTRVNQCRQWA